MERPDLSIVIPSYNEAERITPTLRAVSSWLADRGWRHEILVIDDGSTDDTVRVVKDLAREVAHLRSIESRPNRGKGHVVRLGMLSARGRYRLFMDADGSTSIDQLPALMARIQTGADVAIGSRRAPGAVCPRKQPWYRRAWSHAANRVVRAALVGGVRDTQCGFKLFTDRAAEMVFPRVTTAGWGFDLEALATAARMGMRIDEVPVAWADDRRSRIRPLRDAMAIAREFWRIRRAMRGFAASPCALG